MKTRNLLRHIISNNCILYDDKGGRVHAKNKETGKKTIIHNGHKVINNYTAKGVCDQLGIPRPTSYQ